MSEEQYDEIIEGLEKELDDATKKVERYENALDEILDIAKKAL